MAIIKDYRGEWDVASVKVNFSNGDQRIYSGCKPLIVPNNYKYDEITNLTGTKWKLNDGFIAPAGYGIFSVNFNFQTEYSTASESGLYVGYHWGTEGPAEGENMCCVAYEDFNPGTLIEFTGGVDATNTNLITWIQANAIKQ